MKLIEAYAVLIMYIIKSIYAVTVLIYLFIL